MSAAAASSRKRSKSARQAILTAAFDLLEEEGFERLSIEGVAARAGVGKTTIYRWWPTKGVLAVEAFLEAVTPAIAFRQSGSARNDIVRQMKSLAKLYRGHTGHLVCQMIGASQLDPAMRKAFTEGFLYPRRECAYTVFRRGVTGGEFRADVDRDVAIDALYSPIYYRLLASGAPIDEAFLDRHIDLVLRGLMA
jgi:AcrR family transcriptional regulator